MSNKTPKPAPHQERVLKKLEKNNKILVYHGLGSGKTYTSLLASKKPGNLSVIGPATLRGNFEKEKKKFNVKTKVDYSSYAKPEPKSKDLIVFDEAHRMGRLESQRSKYPDKFKAKKKLFLTGTPIRNHPNELIPLLRGVDVKIPRNKKKFNEFFIEEKKVHPGLWAKYVKGVKPGTTPQAKNLHILKRHLKGKVDYHATDPNNYPTIKEKKVEVQMGPKQLATYNLALKESPDLAYKLKKGIPPSKAESNRMNAFLNATRQISNTPKAYNINVKKDASPKIKRIVKDIKTSYKKDPNYKGLTYSNYLDSGVSVIAKQLAKSKIPYGIYTGQTSQKDRDRLVKQYNKGKIRQLLISGAGTEGLDLKGTKTVQITEPHWNTSKIKQTIGRAARYQSHEHLPENERKVDVRKYISVNPEPSKFRKFFGAKRPVSTDEYLYSMADQKQKLNSQFLNALKEAS